MGFMDSSTEEQTDEYEGGARERNRKTRATSERRRLGNRGGETGPVGGPKKKRRECAQVKKGVRCRNELNRT